MSIPDLINGNFEFIAGILLWLNVRKIYRDKKIRGIHVFPTMFFALWGYWNLFYYPHLQQWISFIGGIMVVVPNTVWVILAIYYIQKEKKCVV